MENNAIKIIGIITQVSSVKNYLILKLQLKDSNSAAVYSVKYYLSAVLQLNFSELFLISKLNYCKRNYDEYFGRIFVKHFTAEILIYVKE